MSDLIEKMRQNLEDRRKYKANIKTWLKHLDEGIKEKYPELDVDAFFTSQRELANCLTIMQILGNLSTNPYSNEKLDSLMVSRFVPDDLRKLVLEIDTHKERVNKIIEMGDAANAICIKVYEDPQLSQYYRAYQENTNLEMQCKLFANTNYGRN